MKMQENKQFFIEELVDVTSVGFAHNLVEKFRGQRIYVPVKKPHSKHPLSLAFNENELELLIDNFSGDYIHVPMKLVNDAAQKRCQIFELRSKSYGIQQIAAAVGCSWRWVNKVLAKRKKSQEVDANQASLFDD